MTTLRIGYTCHDAFPSTDTNTQQIFWTLAEVARLDHRVDVHVPLLHGGASAPELIARHYGAADGRLPETLRFLSANVPSSSAAAKAWFDLRAPWRWRPRAYDVVWTRDPLALASALQRPMQTVFETYRPDFATAPRFAAWRRATLDRGATIGRGRPRLAGVIAHSALAADAFARAGVSRERLLVAHNGHAPELMQPRLTAVEARAAAGLPSDRPLVVYTGHIGPQKGTDAIIALAAALPSVWFVIVGAEPGSTERQWLETCAERAGVSNLWLVPRVSVGDVARYLYAADCLLIPPTADPLERYGRTVLPMKLFSYLAAGRPIVAPRLPDIEEVLVDDQTAVLVPAGDLATAAASLRALLLDAPRRERLGAASCEAARAFTWAARAAVIADAVRRWTTD